MSAALKLPVKRYTYEDYITWGDDVRCELIDGVIYNMAAPTVRHQDIVLEIGTQFKNALRGKKCKPYISPIDVRLNADKPFKKDDTIIQPDIIVLCDPSKVDEKMRSINGAPDLVIEVLSPGTGHKDRLIKFRKYKEAGVREYWLVDLTTTSIEVHAFEEGEHVHYRYRITDPVPVRILEDCIIDISEILPPIEYEELEQWTEPEENEPLIV
jgi:Uma2 family endonuclease